MWDVSTFLLQRVCLVAIAAARLTMALELASVQNLRPIVSSSSSFPVNLYRSATLDNLSMQDAQTLLWHSSSVTIVDLRNDDEIQKRATERTEGAHWFDHQLTTATVLGGNKIEQQQHSLVHIPILQNVDAFWDEAITRMPVQDRVVASVKSTFQAGALVQAAARHLEQGGPAALNTVMLASCGNTIQKALQVVCCLNSAATTATSATKNTSNHDDNTANGGVDDDEGHCRPLVLFHCQKGKDRTGMLAMLLQHCLGDSESEIIQAYGKSGVLLGEDDADSLLQSNTAASTFSAEQNGKGLVDWRYFQGSPESAMKETLQWIQATYGSIDGYLDYISFSQKARDKLLLGCNLHKTIQR